MIIMSKRKNKICVYIKTFKELSLKGPLCAQLEADIHRSDLYHKVNNQSLHKEHKSCPLAAEVISELVN